MLDDSRTSPTTGRIDTHMNSYSTPPAQSLVTGRGSNVGGNDEDNERLVPRVGNSHVEATEMTAKAAISLLEERQVECDGEINNVTPETTKVNVALDSGATVSVTAPHTVPGGVVVEPTPSGVHYTGGRGDYH